ncbi:MAG: transglutaminase-like domain-containing protein, partial [Myxococcota bacterium]|nr:transglutaminase-like domain-containing protein [Myxococcota bacterium]
GDFEEGHLSALSWKSESEEVDLGWPQRAPPPRSIQRNDLSQEETLTRSVDPAGAGGQIRRIEGREGSDHTLQLLELIWPWQLAYALTYGSPLPAQMTLSSLRGGAQWSASLEKDSLGRISFSPDGRRPLSLQLGSQEGADQPPLDPLAGELGAGLSFTQETESVAWWRGERGITPDLIDGLRVPLYGEREGTTHARLLLLTSAGPSLPFAPENARQRCLPLARFTMHRDQLIEKLSLTRQAMLKGRPDVAWRCYLIRKQSQPKSRRLPLSPKDQVRFSDQLRAERWLPSDDEQLRAVALRWSRGAIGSLECAARLMVQLRIYLKPRPRGGAPDPRRIFRERVGDCNEYSALFVTLARAVGLPARLAFGLVQLPEMPNRLGWHGWAQVLGAEGWVDFDPLWGERAPGVTHLCLSAGGAEALETLSPLLGALSALSLPLPDAL